MFKPLPKYLNNTKPTYARSQALGYLPIPLLGYRHEGESRIQLNKLIFSSFPLPKVGSPSSIKMGFNSGFGTGFFDDIPWKIGLIRKMPKGISFV